MILFVVINAFFMQAKAQIITEEKAQHPVCTEDKNMIIGKTTLAGLEQNQEFWVEYLLHYGQYESDKEIVGQIAKLLGRITVEVKRSNDVIYEESILHIRDLSVTVVLGTWCGDSKEQFPVFEKIMEQLHSDVFPIEIIGVDRDKLAGDLDISSLNIEFVPTFIFYENGEELGRIVEIPSETMEKDILNILSKNK